MNNTQHIKQFLQMIESGMTIEDARDYLAEDIKCSPVLTRMYRHWSHTKDF